MKIVQIIAPSPAGGAEQVVLDLTQALAAAGDEVVLAPILEPGGEDHPFVRRVRPPVALHPIVVHAHGYRRQRRCVEDLLWDVAPDVVHTHGYKSDVLDARVARRLGFPTVSTVHGFTGGGLKNRAYEALQRRALRRFDAVVAVSRPLAEGLRRDGVPAARVHTIANARSLPESVHSPAEARGRLGVSDRIFHIGWIGRVSAEKGPDLLLEALSLLDGISFRGTFIGDGPRRGELQVRTARLGLGDRVEWPGSIPEAARFLPAFDLLVVSSRTEGTPIVVLEGMAAGIPLVATRVGGIPDMLETDEALVVEPESPAALAGAIREVHDRPDEAVARAERARRRFEAVGGTGPWARAYLDLYVSLLRRGRDGPRPGAAAHTSARRAHPSSSKRT